MQFLHFLTDDWSEGNHRSLWSFLRGYFWRFVDTPLWAKQYGYTLLRSVWLFFLKKNFVILFIREIQILNLLTSGVPRHKREDSSRPEVYLAWKREARFCIQWTSGACITITLFLLVMICVLYFLFIVLLLSVKLM